MDIKEELKKYKEMLDEGLITQEDFEKLKNKILEIDVASSNSGEDHFKTFRENNSVEPTTNAIANEVPVEKKKADIDTSWLHEEYEIPLSSGTNSTSFGSTVQSNNSRDASIQIDNRPAKKKFNGFCIAGGALGAVAALILNPFCLVAVLGLIFSIIGLVACQKKGQPGKGYAITGIILSGFAIVIFFVSIFTSFTLFSWMQGTNLPIGGRSETSAVVATEKTSNTEIEKNNSSSQQEPATTTVTFPDLTGNWIVDNCVFPDGTSKRGYKMTDINVRFHGLTYIMDFPAFNFSSSADLNYVGGSHNGAYSVYSSSDDGTDAVVYFDDVLYMKLKVRDDLNNDVMGYYVLVREGDGGFGSLTTEDGLAICNTMDSVIDEVRAAAK